MARGVLAPEEPALSAKSAERMGHPARKCRATSVGMTAKTNTGALEGVLDSSIEEGQQRQPKMDA